MSMPLVSISFIHFSTKTGYTTKHFVEPFLKSLAEQTYANVEICCVENGSEDKSSMEYVKQYPHITIIELPENISMAGHNEAIKRAKGKYIWAPTLDTVYDPTFLETLVEAAEKLPDGGSFGGTILSLSAKGEKTYKLDTSGIQASVTHHFKERDAGKIITLPIEDTTPKAIFGICGASILYRASAVKEIQDSRGLLIDPDYFMYKEDIDVAYRFLWAGWKNYYIPNAIGYHVRTAKEKIRLGSDVLTAAVNRKGKADYAQRFSLRNHLYLLYKNFSFSLPFYIVLRTIIYECMKFGGLLLVGPKLYPVYIEFWKKRKTLQKVKKTASPKEVAKYFN